MFILDEFALNDVGNGLLVIKDNGVDLLVVSVVGDAVACLVRILSMNVPDLPGHESLTVIREVLLVVILDNDSLDLLVHASLRCPCSGA